MNIVKIIFGALLVAIPLSYPIIGTAVLKGLGGVPFPLILVLGIGLLIGGAKLIFDGLNEA